MTEMKFGPRKSLFQKLSGQVTLQGQFQPGDILEIESVVTMKVMNHSHEPIPLIIVAGAITHWLHP